MTPDKTDTTKPTVTGHDTLKKMTGKTALAAALLAASSSAFAADRPFVSLQWAPDGRVYSLALQPVDAVPLKGGFSLSYGPVAGLRLRDGVPVGGAGLSLVYGQRRAVVGASLSLVSEQSGPVRPVLGASVGFRL
jgi:hypothetical protein